MEYFFSSDCRHYFVGDSVPLTKNTETGIWISELKLKYSENMQYDKCNVPRSTTKQFRMEFCGNHIRARFRRMNELSFTVFMSFGYIRGLFSHFLPNRSDMFIWLLLLLLVNTYIFPKHAISNRSVCDPLVYDNLFPICFCCCCCSSAFNQPISLLSHPNIQHECNFCNRQLLFVVPAAIPEFHFISIFQSNLYAAHICMWPMNSTLRTKQTNQTV